MASDETLNEGLGKYLRYDGDKWDRLVQKIQKTWNSYKGISTENSENDARCVDFILQMCLSSNDVPVTTVPVSNDLHFQFWTFRSLLQAMIIPSIQLINKILQFYIFNGPFHWFELTSYFAMPRLVVVCIEKFPKNILRHHALCTNAITRTMSQNWVFFNSIVNRFLVSYASFFSFNWNTNQRKGP